MCQMNDFYLQDARPGTCVVCGRKGKCLEIQIGFNYFQDNEHLLCVKCLERAAQLAFGPLNGGILRLILADHEEAVGAHVRFEEREKARQAPPPPPTPTAPVRVPTVADCVAAIETMVRQFRAGEYPVSKINIIKNVRALTGLGLKEAKDTVEEVAFRLGLGGPVLTRSSAMTNPVNHTPLHSPAVPKKG